MPQKYRDEELEYEKLTNKAIAAPLRKVPMKKPDRFERLVENLSTLDHWNVPVVGSADAIDALRKEHRWVERMITKERRELALLAFKTRQSNDPRDVALADCLYARVSQCGGFLHRLQQRRK